LKYPSILTPENDQLDPLSHPPTTNRGVETASQERIDWISFTVPYNTSGVWPDALETEFTETKSFNGYDIAKEYPDGRVELSHSTRSEMGIHCVMSGKTCSNLRDDLKRILENCWFQGGKVTRFDLALDDITGRINPRDATQYIKSGEIECRAREYPTNQDASGGGYTQYFGKMASEVHICLYEKSAEQGVSGFTVRCEIRFKQRKADKAAKTYLRSNDCRGIILGFVKFPTWGAWNWVFSTEPIKVLAEKTVSHRVAWLLGQVSKSIAKEVYERQGDLEILDKIRESVMAHLSDLRQDIDKNDQLGVA